ncbi:PQQ-binding-like beta-propeller repeat protein [Pelagibacterales bacterium SAG-MED29]|nr:PQQ-binding-like beta-propeller repeat protein [Pelagibacterales bacterium SAG-MED29]
MRKLILIIFIFVCSHCSFDNKSGIWKNSDTIDVKKTDRFKDFETLYTKEQSFNQTIAPNKNLDLLLDSIKKNTQWTDEFYQDSNNFDNFEYDNLNEIIFKSKKISRHKINDKILFDGENVIATDIKGNIFVYSINKNEIIYKYNFYKKKFKKIKKNLNIIIEENIIYASDNLGYLYALNYMNKKLLWAKNFKIPFRSNIKIFENKIITADQNNTLHILNKFNGLQLKFIPTEETALKTDFVNSLALYKDSLIYLNTFGSLYSVSNQNSKINWFANFKQSLDLNSNNLFYSNPVVIFKDKVIISTDPYLYLLNINNGSVIFRISITSIVKPLVSGKNLFIITKDHLLICIDTNTGEIIYSLDIAEEIADFLDTKNKSISIKSLSLANNNLLVFLNNSYLVAFNKNGKIKKIGKLKSKLGTSPIFINESILFLNNNNKLIVLN